jgi:hypothetical protein
MRIALFEMEYPVPEFKRKQDNLDIEAIDSSNVNDLLSCNLVVLANIPLNKRKKFYSKVIEVVGNDYGHKTFLGIKWRMGAAPWCEFSKVYTRAEFFQKIDAVKKAMSTREQLLKVVQPLKETGNDIVIAQLAKQFLGTEKTIAEIVPCAVFDLLNSSDPYWGYEGIEYMGVNRKSMGGDVYDRLSEYLIVLEDWTGFLSCHLEFKGGAVQCITSF